MNQKFKRIISLGIASALIVNPSILPLNTNGLEIQTVQAAQAKPIQFQSAKTNGGSYTDSFQKVEFTKDGGFIAMGYTMGESEDPNWGYYTTGSHLNNDAVLVKYDKNHKLQWSKNYGTTGVDIFNDMTILKDGKIAVAGRSSFTSSDNKIKNVSWYVLVINPDNPDDYKEYRIGGTAGDQAYGIKATDDGGFVVGGWTASKEGYLSISKDSGSTYSDPTPLWQASTGTQESLAKRNFDSGSECAIIKIRQDDTIEYTSIYSAQKDLKKSNRLESLTIDNNNDIVITGYVSTAKNIRNAIIAKLSGKDGSLLWERVAGSTLTDAPTDAADYQTATYSNITVLKDGSYVACGSSTNHATTEENWKVTGEKDSILVHYKSDGTILNSENIGTISDNYTLLSGVVADNDGGYIAFGSSSGVINEDEKIKKGYNWGNYGAQDGILIKYNNDDTVAWSENYGTKNGDWINDVIINDNNEVIAVGESNGKYGNPLWSNNGGMDAIIMSSEYYEDLSTPKPNLSQDKDAIWKDGIYTSSADGYAGKNSISMQVTIENHKITSVVSTKNRETEEYFERASRLFNKIVQNQSTNVDIVSGATLSSNGIIEATQNCLSSASAAWVDDLILGIETISDSEKQSATQTAIDAYTKLGANSTANLTNLEKLKEYASTYNLTLPEKITSDTLDLTETQPELAKDSKYNDTYYKLQSKYYNNIHAQSLAEKGLTGKGIKIAVIDSGITPNQEDLDYSKILEGYDYVNNCKMNVDSNRENLTDSNGHGTAVAGILSAISNNNLGITGLLSDVQLVPLKVNPINNDKKEEESIASSKTIAQAIKDAVDIYNVDVITTSLDVKATDELKEAVEYADSKNVIIVGAAGNSSSSESTGNDTYIYPASYDTVIGVGAVDNNNQVRETSQKNDQVFVTAPGDNIALLAINKGAKCKISSGTSYASPLVAAMAAAAKQIDKNTTPAQFKELLKETSQDAGEKGYDTSYGYGIIDMKKFSQKLVKEEEKPEETTAEETTTEETTAEETTAEQPTPTETTKAPTTPTKPTETKKNPTKPKKVLVKKITIKGISHNIAVGKKVKLTASITPQKATNKKITWVSNNKKIATVSKQGIVTIKKKTGGKTVTITAKATDGSKKKATFKIKVMKGTVKKITISSKKSVKAGKSLSLKAKVTASKGANKKLTWTSSNTKYATVSSSGKVKTLKAGKNKTVKITAKATDGSNIKKTVSIKIK